MSTSVAAVPDAALDAFAAALGDDAVLTSDADAARVPGPVLVRVLGRLHRRRGRHADGGRAGAGDRPHRERAQGPAVDALAGAQQRLRRSRAAGRGLGDRVAARDEPGARDQRGARVRGGGAGGALVRSLRRDQGGRAQADAVDRGRRLGQRDRQHARPRPHLPASGPGPGRVVRHGGGAAERRADANGHGRAARQQGVARLQARARAHAGPALHAVELRDRDEDGLLAAAVPRGVHALLAARLERRRAAGGRGHAARPDARQHDQERAPDREHRAGGRRRVQARPVVGRRRPDPRRGARQDRPRAGVRPLDDALRAARGRGGRGSEVREDQAGVRAHRRRGGVGHEVRAGGRGRAREPARAGAGRRAEPRPQRDGGVGRRPERRPRGVLAGGADDGRRRGRAARAPARQGRGRRPRLHGGADRDEPALLRAHHADHLRHGERGEGTGRLRRREAARPRVRAARIRGVPRAPRLHGPRGRAVQLRRPRVPALQRDDQGCARPERHPRAGQARDLAQGHARAAERRRSGSSTRAACSARCGGSACSRSGSASSSAPTRCTA